MNGFINILKPPGMTSHDVIVWLRKLFSLKKIGHGGTLDPNAVGVLPVALGKGTRLLEYILNSDKSYRCEIVFGVVTTTQDLDGEIIVEKPVSKEQLAIAPTILQDFMGEIEQRPPMVSAVRHQGKRLYELARQGVEVERPTRRVIISKLELLETSFDKAPYTMLFDVDCSKGTYIRTLCHDLGERLGCGASLSFLLRTKTGSFSLADAWPLEEIEVSWKQGQNDFLLPLDGVLSLPVIIAKEQWVPLLLQGRQIPLLAKDTELSQNQLVQIVDSTGLIAIAEVVYGQQGLSLQPKKVLK